MKELITKYGFELYHTGCSCVGLPRYYKHQDFFDYKIILKAGFATIKKSGIEEFKTKDIEQLKEKLIEYGIVSEN